MDFSTSCIISVHRAAWFSVCTCPSSVLETFGHFHTFSLSSWTSDPEVDVCLRGRFLSCFPACMGECAQLIFQLLFFVAVSSDPEVDSYPALRRDWRGAHRRCFSFFICPRQLHLEIRTFILSFVSGRHRFGVCVEEYMPRGSSGRFLQVLPSSHS